MSARQRVSWFQCALLGFLGFGGTNFLLGCIVDWSGRNPDASISAPIVVWLTMGLAGTVAAVSFQASGRGFRGIPGRRFVLVAAAAGIALSLGMMTLKIGLAAEPTARGPIVAISTTNSMLVAGLSLLVLRERLSRTQAGGFFVILAGLTVLALSSGTAASLRALAFGLATMLCFGAANFLLKYAGHHGADSVSATAVLWLSSGAMGILALLWALLSGRGLAGLNRPDLFLAAVGAGAFLAVGMLAVKMAVTRGPAGPATAITGSNALLVTVLDYFVFGHLPSAVKLTGMFVALAGIVVLALGGRFPHRKAAAPGRPHGH